jgi:spore coat-associated protein N
MTHQLKRRSAAATGIAAVAAIALGSGTYAAFTATQAGPGGTLTAGTLTLDMGGFDTTEVFDSDIVPGQVVHRTVTATNTGSIAGSLSEQFTVTGKENGCTTSETAAGGCSARDGNLQEPDQLQVSLDGVHYEPVSRMAQPGWLPPIPLAAHASVTQQFYFKLPDNNHNNRVQSDKLRIQSIATLNQA